MKMKLLSLSLVACLGTGVPALAASKLPSRPAPMTRQVYEAQKARIEAEAKADRKLCDRLRGGRKDVCEAETRGRADALKAELDARYKPSPEASQKAKNVTAQANYAVAKAKCRLLEGDAEDDCMDQAKLAREAAIRQAKVEKVKETGGPFASSSPAAKKKEKAQAGAS